MTHTVWAWIVAHQVIIYYVVAVLIEQLPEPVAGGTSVWSAVYKYFYSVIQILGANWKRGGASLKK